MSTKPTRKLGVAAAIGAATALVLGAAAWACTSLATLSPNPLTAAPGQRVTVTGENFTPGGGPVSFRFSSLAAPVLTTATPNQAGELSATFRVPNAAPGSYVLMATQVKDGEPVFGTPARAVLVIPGAGGSTATPPVDPGSDRVERDTATALATETDTSDTLSLLVLAVTGVAGLALFVAGVAAFAVTLRRRTAAQEARS